MQKIWGIFRQQVKFFFMSLWAHKAHKGGMNGVLPLMLYPLSKFSYYIYRPVLFKQMQPFKWLSGILLKKCWFHPLYKWGQWQKAGHIWVTMSHPVSPPHETDHFFFQLHWLKTKKITIAHPLKLHLAPFYICSVQNYQSHFITRL